MLRCVVRGSAEMPGDFGEEFQVLRRVLHRGLDRRAVDHRIVERVELEAEGVLVDRADDLGARIRFGRAS